MMTTLRSLKGRIREDNIRAVAEYGNQLPPEDFKDSTPWKVTLKRKGRQMTVDFYTGPAWEKEPTAADVLDCLLSDVASYEQARDFEDWCGDYGYDPDSRKAERIYKQIGQQREKLRRFLGDAADAYLYETDNDA